ncbi:Uma2 family endonuclease [Kitasatospora sp. RB6PN24]|uniref:Uma2 family endonuclease n=1 Tax=Kitasatospora humi TaxID=2893891 RepID=UPI001E35A56F|nr:Uma2 family endonuclease [Kitasatospora humi]MCC9310356.1 Uma2 family endonuclease [Kitasatospora humi]
MAADPTTEPLMSSNPIDLLIAFEEATDVPIRPEYIEGAVCMPPPPDYDHNHGAMQLLLQLHAGGWHQVGVGCGFATVLEGEDVQTLVIPDFYVLNREPTELDDAFRKVHKGWYPINMLALAGEVTSGNPGTDTGPEYRSYASAGVAVYVLVNREEKRAHAHFDPDPAARRYRSSYEAPLGEKLPLPAPYPALDTSAFRL